MILAVDPGLNNVGWAVVRPSDAAVIDLGVLVSKPAPKVNKSTDRARRTTVQAKALHDVAVKYRCTTIAAEAVSISGGPARFSMATSLNLSWGVLCALAAALGAELLEVTPKRWQAAMLDDGDKPDYEQVFAVMSNYVRRTAAQALVLIPKGKRNHAVDSAGIGLYAARGPLMTLIAKGRAA